MKKNVWNWRGRMSRKEPYRCKKTKPITKYISLKRTHKQNIILKRYKKITKQNASSSPGSF